MKRQISTSTRSNESRDKVNEMRNDLERNKPNISYSDWRKNYTIAKIMKKRLASFTPTFLDFVFPKTNWKKEKDDLFRTDVFGK